jgi:lipid-A-disaccharide synthase
METPSVLIVAAEDSSTLYAMRLLEKWKSSGKEVSAFGVGSQEMESFGFERLGNSEDMAVVGFSEIVTHWKVIKSVYFRVLDECKKRKPKFALLMDYPGFNLRLAKKLKKMGIPVVYYISPQIWAWKEGRIHTMRDCVDQVLVILPFEQDFYEKRGVRSYFVGHPLLDELTEELMSETEQKLKRQKFGVSDSKKVLGLMPGSRITEIRLNFATQMEVAKRLVLADPNLHVQILLAPSLKKSDLDLSQYDFPFSVIQLKPFEMIGMCDVILCASGTATLMVALIEKPMVIMYKMNSISAWLARVLVKIPFFGLVNIIAQREIAPERFQGDANPDELSKHIKSLLYEPEARKKMIGDLKGLKEALGTRGATDRVAKVLERYL